MAWDFISKNRRLSCWNYLSPTWLVEISLSRFQLQIWFNAVNCIIGRQRMHIDRWYKLKFSGVLGSQRTPINSSIFWLKTAHYNPHENYTRISVANWCCLLQWATPHILYERNPAWFERPRINWLCTHTPQRENINLGSLHAGTMQTIPLNYSVMTYDPKTLEMFSHLPV